MIEKLFENLRLYEEQLHPSFDKLMTMLEGDDPSIKSVCFMTSQYPMAKDTSDEENEALYEQLINNLEEIAADFVEIGGKYGHEEDSVIIFNREIEDYTELGIKYKQESLVVGRRSGDNIVYSFYYPEEGKYEESTTSLTYHEGYDPDNYYSVYRGRKFTVDL